MVKAKNTAEPTAEPLKYRRKLVHAKHRLKRATPLLLTIFVILVIAGGIAWFVAGREDTSWKKNPYEITTHDLLALRNWTSSDVTVKGLRLGDSVEQVTEKIGKPDDIKLYPPNIANLYYGKALNLADYGLILHMNAGILSRITIRPPFNQYLIGSTQIGKTKEEIYAMFGAPDNTRHVQVDSESGKAYRLIAYDGYKIEFILDAGDEIGLSFYL